MYFSIKVNVCHACSSSLALEGARLPVIMPSCYHHYAQLCSVDPPGLPHFVDFTWKYMSAPLCCSKQHCLSCCVHVLMLFLFRCMSVYIKWFTPCTCFSSPALGVTDLKSWSDRYNLEMCTRRGWPNAVGVCIMGGVCVCIWCVCQWRSVP